VDRTYPVTYRGQRLDGVLNDYPPTAILTQIYGFLGYVYDDVVVLSDSVFDHLKLVASVDRSAFDQPAKEACIQLEKTRSEEGIAMGNGYLGTELGDEYDHSWSNIPVSRQDRLITELYTSYQNKTD
jgi:hypothetical protein